MKNVIIGGVPEHFNLPWHLCIEENLFAQKGLNIIWKDFPEGTGAMCQALRNNEIDIAIILSEGIIKDITAGNPSKIVQVYVDSPLIWGIHVSAKSNYKTIEDLKGTTAAISRYGSGSHLMAYINAQNNNWDTSDLDFNVINNVQGAIDALSLGQADYFMWEHFTTKPLVDKGTFRRVADCPTPWPCFVIAAREEFIKNNTEELKSTLEVINSKTRNFKQINGIDKILAERYDQKLEDIKKWLSITTWSEQQLPEKTLNNIQHQLSELDIINKELAYNQICANL